MNQSFGNYLRKKRLTLRLKDASFSLRRVAARIGVEPSFLSKVERSLAPPPSEEKIITLARVLGEDPDFLLALAGSVSRDLQQIIRDRPLLFGSLLRDLKAAPDAAVSRMAREAKAEYGIEKRKEKK